MPADVCDNFPIQGKTIYGRSPKMGDVRGNLQGYARCFPLQRYHSLRRLAESVVWAEILFTESASGANEMREYCVAATATLGLLLCLSLLPWPAVTELFSSTAVTPSFYGESDECDDFDVDEEARAGAKVAEEEASNLRSERAGVESYNLEESARHLLKVSAGSEVSWQEMVGRFKCRAVSMLESCWCPITSPKSASARSLVESLKTEVSTLQEARPPPPKSFLFKAAQELADDLAEARASAEAQAGTAVLHQDKDVVKMTTELLKYEAAQMLMMRKEEVLRRWVASFLASETELLMLNMLRAWRSISPSD
eukprot:Skav227053  [mRNA]  locus=scaffold72:789882:812626:- [translate_table: standard]